MVTAATITIDNTSGCQLYLPAAAGPVARIVTSKSSAVNVSIPARAGEELTEAPIPEQFVTVWRGGRWVTEPTDHTAG